VVDSAGIYLVTVSTANGCAIQDSLIITEDISLPVVTIAQGDSIELTCLLDSVYVVASGASSYSWNVVPFWTDDSLLVYEPGQYVVTGMGTNGCEASATIIVTADTLSPVIVLDTLSSGAVLTCSVDIVEIMGNGAASYEWTDALGQLVSSGALLQVDSAGTYVLTRLD